MMVNTRDVKQGDELIMEDAAAYKRRLASVEAGSKRKAASWKDVAAVPKKPWKEHKPGPSERARMRTARSEAAGAGEI